MRSKIWLWSPKRVIVMAIVIIIIIIVFLALRDYRQISLLILSVFNVPWNHQKIDGFWLISGETDIT